MIPLVLSAVICGICMMLALIAPFCLFPGLFFLMVLTVRSLYLHRQSRTDALTKLYNLRHLNAMKKRYRRREQVTVYYLDLDHLKRVNDSRGHGAGDRLLRETAEGLKEIVRDQGEVYRIGGDEFLLILRAPLPDDPLSRFPATYGTASGPGESLDALILQADQALYRKRSTD